MKPHRSPSSHTRESSASGINASETSGFEMPRPSECWSWSRDAIAAWQLERLNAQFAAVLPHNEFYRESLGTDLRLNSLDELASLPITHKEDLVQSADSSSEGLSGHHTYPPSAYSRMHRTSGTTGTPLKVLDTEADWRWWSQTWQHVLDAAQVQESDRAFLAFSFGPFVGFWSAHQAIADRGALAIPGGGLSSLARLDFMRTSGANIVCCTPSYALHLAAVAKENEFDLASLPIDRLIVAGEAGGSVPSVRQQIESAWSARVIDHSGATEIGPWGFGWQDRIGLHIIETSFIAELIPVATANDSPSDKEDAEEADELFELLLTSIGRLGAPVIRYRTGDVVKIAQPPSDQCNFLWLPEGVVGRADNMVTIRGVNVFPSSVDRIVREVLAMAEYRVTVTRDGHLDQLSLEVEASAEQITALQQRFETRLGLRIPVTLAQPNSLPRSEGKSRRWIDNR